MSWYIEQGVPGVLYNGLNTQKAVDFSGASSVALPGTTFSGAVTGITSLTMSGALSGGTTASFSSTASIITGTSAVTAGALAMRIGGSSTFGLYWGSGIPTVTAGKGSLYLRTDGTTTSRAYINTDGASAWTFLSANY